MNQESLQRTLPGKRIACWAFLHGYKRAFNKAGRNNHRYLNIKPEQNSKIEGVLIEVSQEELGELAKREQGYNLVDVTNQVDKKPYDNICVYAFVAPSTFLQNLKVSRKYLDTVLSALPPEKRDAWMEETDMEGAEVDEQG